jgi:PAS domain S-box-containing protein
MAGGLLLNICAPRLFMGFNYLLGSIAVLLVVRLYGTAWGTLSGLIAGSWTYVLFGHPYAMVWLTAEPLFIGLFFRLTTIRNLVLLNTLYWPFVGIPLLWFFFTFVMKLPMVGTLPAALMFWVIGITNSLMATILLQYTPLSRLSGTESDYPVVTMQQATFSIMMSLVVFPAILAMVINGRAIMHRNEDNIVDRLLEMAEIYPRNLHVLLEWPLKLLEQQGNGALPEQLLQNFGVTGLWALDQRAGITRRYAASGAPAQLPQRFAENKNTNWAGLVDDALFLYRPQDGGACRLSLNYLREHLEQQRQGATHVRATLLDPEGRVIFSDHPASMAGVKGRPEGRPVRDTIVHVLPPMPSYVTLWRRVQQSWYRYETPPDELIGWRWVLEIPFAPYQTILLKQQTHSLAYLLLFCLVALAVSFFISKMFSRSILQLANITTGLEERVEADQPIHWPETRLGEVKTLNENFKKAADSLRRKFRELKQSYELMEENVAARTIELRAAKEQAERVYRLMPSALFAVDLEHRIIIWNRKAEQLTGYLASEVLGKECLMFSGESCASSCRLRCAGELPAEGITCTIIRKDGTAMTVSKNIDYLVDGLGEIIGGIESFEDITEKMKLEDQVRQAQKMEAIGTLAGGIAHDFNNILGAMLGYAEMAREDSEPGSRAADELDKVLEAGNRAAGLVRQILAFSRQTPSEAIALNPAFILKEAVKLLRSSFPSTITIRQHLAPAVHTIIADPTQIHQVVMNLCTNAFHAMEQTGGTLDIIVENRELGAQDIQPYPKVNPGKFVVLTVRDTGPGVPAAIRDRIFEPYFTTKEIGKGTGMGLAIVHGIVTALGGFVTCESRPGQGAVFHAFLPAAPSDVVIPSTVSADSMPTGQEHVLFVDDEEILAELGKTMLERLGYQVTMCTESTKALSLFEEHPDRFDILVTDQTMPGMTGFDLARKALHLRPDIPVILCTGYSNLVNEQAAQQAGIRGFIMKPLTKKGLAELLATVKNERDAHEQPAVV